MWAECGRTAFSAVSDPGHGVSCSGWPFYLCLAVDALAAREGRLVALLLLFGRRFIVITVVEEIVGLRHLGAGIISWVVMMLRFPVRE
jgi:hypothetical protein